ncbi:MAG: hypothetical protein IKQ37_03020 [Bacteroidaceae bacterium]|nr:hypothetical protein [Bacteroidaceae bacterium]
MEWTTRNGVNGHKITSISNGRSLFLPVAGICGDAGLDRAGSYGYYWTRSLLTSYSDKVVCIVFGSGLFSWLGNDRYNGQSIRPVRVE